MNQPTNAEVCQCLDLASAIAEGDLKDRLNWLELNLTDEQIERVYEVYEWLNNNMLIYSIDDGDGRHDLMFNYDLIKQYQCKETL